MTKSLFARKKTARKIQKLGAAGLGTSVTMMTSGAAMAYQNAPAWSPVQSNHASFGVSHSGPGAGSAGWAGQISHAFQSATGHSAIATHSASTLPNISHKDLLGANAFAAQHGRINQSSANVSWLAAQNPTALTLSKAGTISGTELDLSSSAKNIVLGSNVFQGATAATIKVGGKELTFTAGQRVTAAEYLAITEVLSGSSQTLKINGSGVANGGSFDLNNTGVLDVSGLVIPTRVVALDNLSAPSQLALTGDLLNYGSIFTYGTGALTARDIVIEKSGLISTQLPAALIVKIAGITLSNGGDLTLSASDGIVNAGKIVAGGSLNLEVGAGGIVNSGTISAVGGNINLGTHLVSSDLDVVGQGGTFKAPNGAINLRTSDYAGSANVNVNGGNYLSNTLNIYSGNGTITGTIQNVTGQVNTVAGVEHFAANTANLILGTNTVSGDPTFVNNGNITISGVNTFSEDVAIIANGNITGVSGASIVDTGHSVTLIAGVAPGSGTPASGAITGGGISGPTTIDFASGNNKGGNIDFTASTSAAAIDTSSNTYTAGGGNVTLAAFAKGATGGSVLFSTASAINTNASIYGSTGTNNGGAVNIIAGADPTTGKATVQVGNITTNGSNGQILSGFNGQPTAIAGIGGAVNICTAQPTTSGGGTVTFNSQGDITAGGPIVASNAVSANAQVNIGNVLTGAAGQGGPAAGGNISISAGGDVSTGSLATFGTVGSPFMNINNGAHAAQVGGQAGIISVQSANGGISVNGAINAVGGSGGNGGSGGGGGGGGGFAAPGAAGGSGGAVTLVSAGNVSVNGTLSTSGGFGGQGVQGNPASGGGAGGNAGSIAISTSNSGSVSVTGDVLAVGGAGGNGGNGAIVMFPVNTSVNGVGGAAGGNGGSISLLAGGDSATFTGIVSSAGGAGGSGGAGVNGAFNGSSSTAGGLGGNGGGGGAAGSITLQAGTLTTGGGLTAVGGAGGIGGKGGNGVAGQTPPGPTGSVGGSGGSGGAGGAAGVISLTAANFSGPLLATGGSGGLAGVDGALTTNSTAVNGANGQSAYIYATAGGATSGAITGSNIVLSSPSGVSLTLNDNVTASGVVTVNAGAAVSVGNNAAVSGSSIAISGVSGNDLVLNLIGAGSLLVATSGDVTINGATGNSVAVNNAGVVSAVNGNIYINSQEAVTSNNAGGNVSIGGGGTLKVGTGVIDISANTQSGSPAANRIEFTGGQTFVGNAVLNAGGQTQLVQIDDGATVVGQSTVTVNSSTLFEIGSGTITGNPLIVNSQARGGVIANSSGSLDLSTLGPLVFNGQSLVILSTGGITDSGNAVSIDLSSSSGTGGSLSLLAGYNFVQNGGNLNYPPLDTTSSYVLTGAGSGAISLGNTTINTSGQTSAGSVLAVANGAIAIGSITANAVTGVGGSINIIGSGITVSGSIDTTSLQNASLGGSVAMTAAAPMTTGTVIVGGGFVAGAGFIPGAASGAIAVGQISSGGSPITLIAAGNGANITTTGQLSSSNIALVTSGAVNLSSGKALALQGDASGNGGHLSIHANSLTWSDSAAQPLLLDASAVGINGQSGNGGSVVVVLQSSNPVSIGTQAGAIELDARGGAATGNGGSISLTTGGNLTASPAALSVSVGGLNSKGGLIALTAGAAGSGTLLITGALSVDGTGTGQGGTIDLFSNSAVTFNIGSTAKTNTSGVLGALTAAGPGGTLQIENAGGGITNATALKSVSNLTEIAGGSGTLALGSSLSANKGLQSVTLQTNTGAITKSGTLTTAKISLLSSGGNLGTASGAFSVVAGEIEASAKGLVNIKDTLKSDISIDASNAGTSFKLVSAGAIAVDGQLTAGTALTLTTSGTNLGITLNDAVAVGSATGTATLTATGTGIINDGDGAASLHANTVTLKSGSGTIGTPLTAFNINASVLNLTSTGAVNLVNSGTNALTVNGSNTKGVFALASDGNIIVAKTIASGTSYSLRTTSGSDGSITLNATLGGRYATSIALNADGSGSISSKSSAKLTTKAAGSVVLASGTGNIGTSTASAGTLKVAANNLTANTGGAGFVNLTDTVTSALTVHSSSSGADFDLATSGASTFNSVVSSGGSVNIVEKTGAMIVNSLATISAGNGGIVLENANKTSGTIYFGNNSKVTTMSTDPNGGKIDIVLGAVPTAPVAGTAPASGLTVNNISGGNVFYGKGITANGPVNTINLKGSDVVFNVGTRPITAITLDGAVTITADPSVVAAPADQIVYGPVAVVPAIGGDSVKILTSGGNPVGAVFANQTVMTNGGALSFNRSSAGLDTQGLLPVIAGNNLSLPRTSAAFAEPLWVSETELQTGEIPAVVLGGEKLGVKCSVSSILDIDEIAADGGADSTPVHLTGVASGAVLKGAVSADGLNAKHKIFVLKRGSVIIASAEDTLVRTALGDIKVKASSVAMILAVKNGIAIFNLHDSRKGSIVAVVGSSELSIKPGSMVALCDESVKSFADVNPAQVIGYCNLQERALTGGGKVFTGQYSILHALANVTPLRTMNSSSNEQSRKIFAILLKNAAILNQLCGFEYQQVLKPAQTACLN